MIDSIKRNSPYIVGISGGSGSGKTFFAEALRAQLKPSNCDIILQDSFYFDQSKLFDFDGGSVNFDHPSSIDFDFLADRLASLKKNESIDVPIYDFVTHSRKSQMVKLQPKPIVLVDGILIFHSSVVRAQLDEMIFFDTPESLRFRRRLERDVHERGRTPEGVKAQFYSQVKPMHDEFVEPSKTHARLVVGESDDFEMILRTCFSRLSERL